MTVERSSCGNDRSWMESCAVHPFELAVSGFSGAGKTTLLERLVPRLAPMRIGYLKSDAHRVELDKPGKDTFRLAAAGAADVAIRSGELSGQIGPGGVELREWKTRLSESDAVFLEGFRDEPIPKLLVLDSAGEALAGLESGRFLNVVGLVHPGSAPRTDLPVFHRDDIDRIEVFVRGLWSERIPKVRGLVLAGGRSSRMGVDKAGVGYHGRSQAAWLQEMLGSLGVDAMVSRAPGQDSLRDVESSRILEDRYLGFGPLGGILSALEFDPGAAWFVVGCDLPHLERADLESLLTRRDPFRFASVFLDSDGRFPEPMCSIWEPKSRLRALQFLGLGYRCPRKVLINSRVELVAPRSPDALFNANTPEDRDRARSKIGDVPP